MTKSRTIGFLTLDWAWGTKPLQPNGCAWYRCLLPMKELEKYGWRVGMGFPQINDQYGFGVVLGDNKAVHGWNIVVLKLIMLGDVADAIPAAQSVGQKIVVDVDDFFEELATTNRAYETTDPKRDPKNNRQHYLRTIEMADAVITSTPFLYDYYSKKRKNVFLVRNGIDIGRWTRRKDKAMRVPTIGWVGATPWRSGDLEQLNPFLGPYLKQKGLKFHHSGHTVNAPLAATQLGVNVNFVSTAPMRSIAEYPLMFKDIDIGIVPLNNIPFNQAKSFIKGLEYAAAGVPFIASPSEEYVYLEEEMVGRIARNKDEWLGHFDELLDPKVRKDDIELNYEIVKEKFTMTSRGEDWDQVMEQISKL